MAAPAPSPPIGFPSLRSESLAGSLCLEIDRLRGRWRQLAASLERCQDRTLRGRLARERVQLQRRRQELLEVARDWRRRGAADSLAIDFLIEVASRPLCA